MREGSLIIGELSSYKHERKHMKDPIQSNLKDALDLATKAHKDQLYYEYFTGTENKLNVF